MKHVGFPPNCLDKKSIKSDWFNISEIVVTLKKYFFMVTTSSFLTKNS